MCNVIAVPLSHIDKSQLVVVPFAPLCMSDSDIAVILATTMTQVAVVSLQVIIEIPYV